MYNKISARTIDWKKQNKNKYSQKKKKIRSSSKRLMKKFTFWLVSLGLTRLILIG